MTKLSYVAPEVEVLEIKVEQGFAASLEDPIYGTPKAW